MSLLNMFSLKLQLSVVFVTREKSLLPIHSLFFEKKTKTKEKPGIDVLFYCKKTR